MRVEYSDCVSLEGFVCRYEYFSRPPPAGVRIVMEDAHERPVLAVGAASLAILGVAETLKRG